MSLNTVRNIMARYIFLLPFLFFSALVLFEIRQTAFLYDSAIHIDAARYLAYPPSHITPSIFELLSTTTSGPVLSIAGALTTAITGKTDNTTPANDDDRYPISQILRQQKRKDKVYYLVRWETGETQWLRGQDISDYAIEQFKASRPARKRKRQS